MVLVSEEDMRQAILRLLRTTHNLAEGAGAASVAAAWKLQEALRGRKVVMVFSGGNIDLATLRWVLG
jgi:threonine dehydratase